MVFLRHLSLLALSLSTIKAHDGLCDDDDNLKEAKYQWKLSEEYIGKNFLSGFNFDAIDDPTNGRVHYVNETIAIEHGLVESNADSFFLRADDKTVLNPEGPGRESVRLISKKQYTTSLMVFDVRRMPEGCGTWPAVWTFGQPWPHLGEIDIIEGINNLSPNSVVLHTTLGCEMPAEQLQPGSSPQTTTRKHLGRRERMVSTQHIRVNDTMSYGPSFNENGGGWFAKERTDKHIKVWFWRRDSLDVPEGVRNGGPVMSTKDWGTPAAYFPSSETCDFDKYLGPHNILINLTFCGDWADAGGNFKDAGCAPVGVTCTNYVNNNPTAFGNAYFDFKAVRIYQIEHVTSGGHDFVRRGRHGHRLH